MAFIPDDLVNRLHELSPKAGLLFVHYCKWRNAETGLTWPSLSTIAKEMAIPKTSACELRKQLIDRGWLELVSGDTVRVVGCFEAFGKVERRSEKSNEKSPASFGKAERDSEKSNDIEANRSEKSNEAFGKVESHNRKYQPMVPAHKGIHVESSDSTARAVKEVFTYWRERLNHPNAKLTPERRRRIEARFREGYTGEQVKQAIDGCASSPFNRGENDRGRPYDDLELICRSGSKLEGFIAQASSRNGNGKHTFNSPTFCGNCDHGYLPPLLGKSEAQRCSCVKQMGVAA